MNNIILKHTFNFGKINYYGSRKENAITLDLELRQRGGDGRPNYIELSICGNVWNRIHTDIICGGQCLDDIAEAAPHIMRNTTFKKLYYFWKKYHLNDMHAGTPEQTAAVDEWIAAGNKYDYTKICEMLKARGLYEVKFTGAAVGRYYNNELYKYGHGWIIEEIPAEIIEEIKELVNRDSARINA